ncbi:MAG: hypothetical protein PHU46_02815 [Rhodocyclaceae bacterium]|nr:hypothetical protein [Rhodocyclaceae bacterium]
MSFTPDTLLRQWQTLRLIPRHPARISAGDLRERLVAEGFEVGKRTVERDLLALSRLFPLVADERSKPFGWSWQKDAPAFDLPGVAPSEALTLLMAREHLRPLLPASVLSRMQPYFRMAEQKLDALGQAPLRTRREPNYSAVPWGAVCVEHRLNNLEYNRPIRFASPALPTRHAPLLERNQIPRPGLFPGVGGRRQ